MMSFVVPMEVVEIVLDHLSDDPKTLATCSLVCSTWIARTRHLLFGTVHLNPWRSHTFVDLISHSSSTIPSHIHQLDINCSLTARQSQSKASKHVPPGGTTITEAVEPLPRLDQFLSAFKSAIEIDTAISGIQYLCLRNMDWTEFSLELQSRIIASLTRLFTKVTRLQLGKVVLHDMRQLCCVLRAFPALERLEAGLKFLKYAEYSMTHNSGDHARLPEGLKEIELSDEGISTVLGSIGAQSLPNAMRLNSLSLKGCAPEMFPYVSSGLCTLSATLESLRISFLQGGDSAVDSQNMLKSFSLSDQTVLRALHIDDINLTASSSAAPSIPELLASITCLTVEFIALHFHVRCLDDLEHSEWDAIWMFLSNEKQFNATNRKRVKITLNFELDTTCIPAAVKKWADEKVAPLNNFAPANITFHVHVGSRCVESGVGCL